MSWLLVTIPETDQPLALCSSEGQTLFLVCDRLGSIRRAITPAGGVAASFNFGPFGEVHQAEGSVPLLIYAGMVCDEHGLYAARRRYYDPSLKRFISLDPSLGHAGQPNSFNPYAYAANNPYRYRDPWGAAPESVAGSGLLMSGKTSEEDRTAARFFAQTPQQQAALDLVFAAEDLQDSVQSSLGAALDLLPSLGQLSPWSASDVDAAATNLADWADEPASDDILRNILALDPNDNLFAPWTPNSAAASTSANPTASAGTKGTQPATGETNEPAPLQQQAHNATSTADSRNGSAPNGRATAPADIVNWVVNTAEESGDVVQPVNKSQVLDRWITDRGDFLPAAQDLGTRWILNRIRRNQSAGRHPLAGIIPQTTADDETRLNNALNRAQEILRRVTADTQDLSNAANDFGRKARVLGDLVDELTGPGQPLNELPDGNPESVFNDLRREHAYSDDWWATLTTRQGHPSQMRRWLEPNRHNRRYAVGFSKATIPPTQYKCVKTRTQQ